MAMVFCRGCGKEIHDSAITCPACGAPQAVAAPAAMASSPQAKVKPVYTSYDQVPWYRKNWLALVCALFFSPGLLLMFLTGDVYYERKGQLVKYGVGYKVFFIVWGVLWLIAIFHG